METKLRWPRPTRLRVTFQPSEIESYDGDQPVVLVWEFEAATRDWLLWKFLGGVLKCALPAVEVGYIDCHLAPATRLGIEPRVATADVDGLLGLVERVVQAKRAALRAAGSSGD